MMYLKWFAIMISKGLMFVYSLPVYPIAYIFRTPARDWYNNGGLLQKAMAFPLWITLDDENDYGEPWYFEQHGFHYTFWASWKWAYLRNNSWNWNNQVVVQPTGMEQLIRSTNEGRHPELDHRRIKWEIHLEDNIWLDGWDVNQGDRISPNYSQFGKSFAIYQVCWLKPDRVGSVTLWRYSYAGRWLGQLWNVKLGFNHRGEALLDIKRMKFHNKYFNHWTPQDLYRNKQFVWLS